MSTNNPLIAVQKHGQSIWYDNIRRSMLTSGTLQRLVDEDGVLGLTSNPSIFEAAIGRSSDYDAAIAQLVEDGAGDALAIFEALAVEDIQGAADVLRPVFDETDGRDGYVSLEVSPYLARDAAATVAEAHRLHAAVDRPNLMIKVPATPECVPAVEELIAAGMCVNVTLLFSVASYEQIADAYMTGLERLHASGGNVSKVASVASFFVSRIDSAVDSRLAGLQEDAVGSAPRQELKDLQGRAAIANAHLAYARFVELFSGERWEALSSLGARIQRVLWASTGTKNPAYSATRYVDELVGPDTVNTIPEATLDAFRLDGKVRNALAQDLGGLVVRAREDVAALAAVGVDLDEVTDDLLEAGVSSFSDAFDTLLDTVERRRQEVLGRALNRQESILGELGESVDQMLDHWRARGNVRRMWEGDTMLWSGADEDQWLGWLNVTADRERVAQGLDELAAHVNALDVDHVVVMGMGGSSLCPDVLRRTFGVQKGWPELLVLDSTVASQVATVRDTIDPARALFVVPSKSGGTIEPNVFKAFFWAEVEQAVGPAAVGGRFVAITDPGTALDVAAQDEAFGRIELGDPTIGGRFSALSPFGMVPAAAMGLDAGDLLERAQLMVDSCAASVPPSRNPGVQLGVVLGVAAQQGRDKLTVITGERLSALGGWMEQLVAESTGKRGFGIVPVDGEALGNPEVYGDDRVFVDVRLDEEVDEDVELALDRLLDAGHPVVRIRMADPRDLGQEFFRWEVATAVAGALLGINAFDQPDVEAAKIAARSLMDTYEETGKLPADKAVFKSHGLALHADERNAVAVDAELGDMTQVVVAHLERLVTGDYFAVNAYLEMNAENDLVLQEIRHMVRDARQVATTLGYGPRFLHSTGQLHKGGPNTGVFLQLTADEGADLEIPGQRFSFDVLKSAQAAGDFQVLVDRERRVLRVHLGASVQEGLFKLRDLVMKAVEIMEEAAAV